MLMIVYQVTMLILFGLFYIASYSKGGKEGKKSKSRGDLSPAAGKKE